MLRLDEVPFVRGVQTHVHNLLAKLSVHSKLEAVAFAVRNGGLPI